MTRNDDEAARDAALLQLTPIHAVALRLEALGVDVRLIAEALGVPPEGVRSLLDVARMKLERVLDGVSGEVIDVRDAVADRARRPGATSIGVASPPADTAEDPPTRRPEHR